MRSAVFSLLLYAALPLHADVQFHAAPMSRSSAPRNKGLCDIRLIVDGDVEVTVRGDWIQVRNIRGRDARDDGSQCTEPLPDRSPAGFTFEKKQGRGEVRLLEEPSPGSDYKAVVSIRNTQSSEEKYHFQFSWRLDTGRNTTDSGSFEGDRNSFPGFDDRHEGGGLSWNNTFHSTGHGKGTALTNGASPQTLSAATVDIDRGGKIFISFRTDHGDALTFSGTLMAPEEDALKAVVSSGSRSGLQGPAYVSRDAKGAIYRITIDVTNGQDRLHLDWDRK
jgi:hypothetical protein